MFYPGPQMPEAMSGISADLSEGMLTDVLEPVMDAIDRELSGVGRRHDELACLKAEASPG
jgi:hypothetical protein